MRYVFPAIATLAWGLWFGGLAALFLFATGLFALGERPVEVGPAIVTGHDLAKAANPQLFLLFARYQLILAAVALVATLGWRLVCASAQVNALFILLAVSGACAAYGGAYMTKKMEPLIREKLTHEPEFRKLHAISMGVSTAQGVVLLMAGAMIPYTVVVTDRRRFLKLAVRKPEPRGEDKAKE